MYWIFGLAEACGTGHKSDDGEEDAPVNRVNMTYDLPTFFAEPLGNFSES